MEDSNSLRGLGFIQYHSDPISNFKVYSTEKQQTDAIIIRDKNAFHVGIPFDFKETESDTPWKFGLNNNYNNKSNLTIQEIYSIKKLKKYFKIEFIFS